MTIKKSESNGFEKARPRIGKPYSMQMGRQHGKGAGHIVTNSEKDFESKYDGKMVGRKPVPEALEISSNEYKEAVEEQIKEHNEYANKRPRGVFFFPTHAQAQLFMGEFLGQMSDGKYENTKGIPWEDFGRLTVRVDEGIDIPVIKWNNFRPQSKNMRFTDLIWLFDGGHTDTVGKQSGASLKRTEGFEYKDWPIDESDVRNVMSKIPTQQLKDLIKPIEEAMNSKRLDLVQYNPPVAKPIEVKEEEAAWSNKDNDRIQEDEDDEDEPNPLSMPSDLWNDIEEHWEGIRLNPKISSTLKYKWLADYIQDSHQGRQWFEKYGGNEFDLRQELEAILGFGEMNTRKSILKSPMEKSKGPWKKKKTMVEKLKAAHSKSPRNQRESESAPNPVQNDSKADPYITRLTENAGGYKKSILSSPIEKSKGPWKKGKVSPHILEAYKATQKDADKKMKDKIKNAKYKKGEEIFIPSSKLPPKAKSKVPFKYDGYTVKFKAFDHMGGNDGIWVKVQE